MFSRRYELFRDFQESILGIVVCKFILLVFSGGDSLLFYLFIYFFTYSFIYLLLLLFSDSVIIIVVIEIILLGLFCPRLDWEYLYPELLGILVQIDDSCNGFSQNPSFGQIDEFS